MPMPLLVLSLFASLIGSTLFAAAAPASSSRLLARSACPTFDSTQDAPFSLPCDQLAGTFSFPNGNQRRPGGIVMLIHGTGSTGPESYGPSPYYSLLPNKGPGYDIAVFSSPTRSLGDAQINAEYIAYNIRMLAEQSSTGKVFLIGHSQGNINIQWALDFWPSTRLFVAGFVSLAGDFHGTIEGPLVCTQQNLTGGGCDPSIIQQSVGSHYLAAQNAKGGVALVPTTSLYTLTDEIIQPEVINPTSALPGSSLIAVQEACATDVTDHFGMLVDAAAFYLAVDALTHGGQASLSRFNPLTMCTYLLENPAPNPFVGVPGFIKGTVLDILAVSDYADKAQSEPLLRPYVCARGDAPSYCAAS